MHCYLTYYIYIHTVCLAFSEEVVAATDSAMRACPSPVAQRSWAVEAAAAVQEADFERQDSTGVVPARIQAEAGEGIKACLEARILVAAGGRNAGVLVVRRRDVVAEAGVGERVPGSTAV
jgi:hypothetical protein